MEVLHVQQQFGIADIELIKVFSPCFAQTDVDVKFSLTGVRRRTTMRVMYHFFISPVLKMASRVDLFE